MPPERSRLAPLVLSDAAMSAIKWLAVVLMVIDHTNKYLFDGQVGWMYAVGRVSMPLFAFVLGYNLARPNLAMGVHRRLALRLAVFGALASWPFVIVNQLPSGWWPLNMMFSFLVAVAVVWLLAQRKDWAVLAAGVAYLGGSALVEYAWAGVGLCVCVWAYQRRPSWGWVAAFLVCHLLLWTVNANFWGLASVPVVMALQRWWRWPLPRLQWAFYAFYPLHLYVFWWLMRMA